MPSVLSAVESRVLAALSLLPGDQQELIADMLDEMALQRLTIASPQRRAVVIPITQE